MIWRVRYLFKWLQWLRGGKPTIKYPGFHCGCCGKWIARPFEIPTYQSVGKWADTIGLCDDEINCLKGVKG